MECFNLFGLIFISVIMFPNIMYALKNKDTFENEWNNKWIEFVEQIGRIGCFGFMIINIPATIYGWWSNKAFALYLIINTLLVIIYCLIWIIYFKKKGIFNALMLSIIPSIIFIFSGVMSRSILLIISAMIFAPSHILITYKNKRRY